jgi:serine/threonine-protein kinase
VRHPLLDVEAIGALEPHLRTAGRIFAVFPHQDSGCVAYGVAIGEERWFVKTARVPEAEPSLRRAVAFHRAVRHPVLIPLRHALTADGRLTLVYPWVDGENLNPATDPKGMGRANPAGALARLRRRPVDEVLGVVDQLLDAHLAVELAGYVAVDLYDGCMLYDFASRALRLCDLDEYRPGPFALDGERLPGSRRFMAPEEWRRGATIDRRTTVFNLGRAARLLLDAGNEERAWRGTPELLAVIDRATRPDPAGRYPSVGALTGAWRAAAGGAGAIPDARK